MTRGARRPGAYIGYRSIRRRRALIARHRSVYGAIGIEITRHGISQIYAPSSSRLHSTIRCSQTAISLCPRGSRTSFDTLAGLPRLLYPSPLYGPRSVVRTTFRCGDEPRVPFSDRNIYLFRERRELPANRQESLCRGRTGQSNLLWMHH